MKMKGKIEQLVPQKWQGRKFYQVTVDDRAYDCWSRGMEDKKVGDEIEFDVIEENGRLTMRFISSRGVGC
jgi:hypothetical protein